MKMLWTLMLTVMLTVVIAVALAGAAHAGTLLATGMGGTANGGECVAANIGGKPVLVNSMKVFDLFGTERTITGTNCAFPGGISPGLACFINFSGIAGARCVIDVATPYGARSIRGTLLLFDLSGGIAHILDAR